MASNVGVNVTINNDFRSCCPRVLRIFGCCIGKPAQKRAEKLAICVNRVLKKFTPVYTLNLGKYMMESEISDWQRQILIIGLLRREKFTNESEALYNGLVKEYIRGNLQFDINFYSKVEEDFKNLEIKKMFN